MSDDRRSSCETTSTSLPKKVSASTEELASQSPYSLRFSVSKLLMLVRFMPLSARLAFSDVPHDELSRPGLAFTLRPISAAKRGDRPQPVLEWSLSAGMRTPPLIPSPSGSRVWKSLIRYRPWFSDLSMPPWTSSSSDRLSLGSQASKARAPVRSASPSDSPVVRLRCQAPPCSVETARRPRKPLARGPET
ncbi:hypothetical protein D3C85_1088780 [compost metagenome]